MTETILITGGTGRFGRKFVTHFAEKGWTVIFTSTCQKRAEEFIARQGLSSNVIAYESNLAKKNAAVQLVESIQKLGLSVNHLVNNARSLESLKTNELGQTDREEFLAEYLMDVVVPYELSIALFNAQPEQLATVTNIGSQYGSVAANPYLYDSYPAQSPVQYGTSKAALSHLTKELAVRFANKNVRVNCVSYGGVEGRVDGAFLKRYAELTPSRRMLNENELVGPLELLISGNCSAVTGHTLIADVGWTLW